MESHFSKGRIFRSPIQRERSVFYICVEIAPSSAGEGESVPEKWVTLHDTKERMLKGKGKVVGPNTKEMLPRRPRRKW